LVIIAIILLATPGKGQNLLDCRFIQASVESLQFKNRFYICNDNSKKIYIIDTTKSFDSCNNDQVCNSEIFYGYNFESIEKKQIVEIYRVDKRKNMITIYFHRPLTGASLILKLKSKKNKIRIVGFEMGAF